MVEMVSPGVYVTEVDASEIVPTVSSTTTVFGGDFTKGPVEKYTEITSVDDLIEFYGLPTNGNYNDWYQCYNYLQYGNRLLVSRACNLNGFPIFTKVNFLALSSQDGYGTVSYGDFGYGGGSNDEKVILDVIFDGVKEGDIIVFTYRNNPQAAISKEYSLRYLVVDVGTAVLPTGRTVTALKLDRDLDLPPKGYQELHVDGTPTVEDIRTWYSEDGRGNCTLTILKEHHNGSCEALAYSEEGEFANHITVPADSDGVTLPMITFKQTSVRYASLGSDEGSQTKYQFVSAPVALHKSLNKSGLWESETKCRDPNPDPAHPETWEMTYKTFKSLKPSKSDAGMLFNTNPQILNPDDFDYKDSMNSFAYAIGGQYGSKLKFFTRTPGVASSYYQISIAVPMDFAANDKDNVGFHCTRYAQPGIPFDNLFEYAPKVGTAQIAVVIYDTVNKEVKETYLCSLDPDEKDSFNNSMFIEKVINRSSNLVYVKCDTSKPSLAEAKEYVSYTDKNGEIKWKHTGKNVNVPNIESYCYVADIDGQYIGNTLSLWCASDSPIQKDDLLTAYEVFEDKDLIDVDIIISNELDNGSSALALAQKRLDCIAFMGIPYEYTESYNLGILAVSRRSAEATSNIVKFRNAINYNTDRMSLVANYKYQYDRYNDTYRWLNVAGDVAGLRARTNQDLAPWWASAGLNRGQIRNVVKLAYNPNQTQRDTLYTNGINPIVDFPGQGIVLWGQKTMLDKASSFDRVNVRCLFNFLERSLAKMSKYQVMEFNDTFTRNRIIAIMKPFLATVQADRGIQDFMVICDTTNNTPDVISRNQLVVDIYIKPTYVSEMIHLNFINCGVNDFSSIISSNNT